MSPPAVIFFRADILSEQSSYDSKKALITAGSSQGEQHIYLSLTEYVARRAACQLLSACLHVCVSLRLFACYSLYVCTNAKPNKFFKVSVHCFFFFSFASSVGPPPPQEGSFCLQDKNQHMCLFVWGLSVPGELWWSPKPVCSDTSFVTPPCRGKPVVRRKCQKDYTFWPPPPRGRFLSVIKTQCYLTQRSCAQFQLGDTCFLISCFLWTLI